MVNPKFISTLATSHTGTSQNNDTEHLQDATDTINATLINTLNIAMGGSFIASGGDVSMNDGGSSYTRYTVTAATFFRDGKLETAPTVTNIEPTWALGTKDWYGLIVVKSNNTIDFRGSNSLGATAIKGASPEPGDIPIASIQILSGSSAKADNRKIQYLGMNKVNSVFSAVTNGVEELRINKEGTVSKKNNSGLISFPSVGSTNATLISTADSGTIGGGMIDDGAIDGDKIGDNTIGVDHINGVTDFGSGVIISGSERTKLTGIDAGADVTDKAKVIAALASLDENDTINIGDAGSDATVNIKGNLTVTGTTTSVDSTSINVTDSFVFEGATDDDFETTLTIADPDADRTITLPNKTGTVALTTDDISGKAATADTLETPRTINGVSFDGSDNVTVTAAAGTLSGTALKSTVVGSSLTSVGTIGTGTWNGTAIADDYIASAATWNGKLKPIDEYTDMAALTVIGEDKLIIYDNSAEGHKRVTVNQMLEKITSTELVGTGKVWTNTLPVDGATVGATMGSSGNLYLDDGETKALESTILNANTTAANVGLGSVDNLSAAAIRSGTTKSNVGLDNVLNQAQITTFTQTSVPAATAAGDIWIDTDNNNKQYRATAADDNQIGSGEWIEVTPDKTAIGLSNVDNTSDATVQAAVLSAASASDVGLGNLVNERQITTFKASSVPTALAAGDIWYDDSNSLKQYRATAAGDNEIANDEWVLLSDDSLKANLASPTFTGTVAGVTKSHIGLGSVDNTADTAKPVSTAQQTVLDTKAPSASPTFTGTVGGVTKTHVGLANVDNTADTAKPVSTAAQTALNAKVPTSRTIAGRALSNDLVVRVNASSGKLEVNDGSTTTTIKDTAGTPADVVFDNRKTEWTEIQDASSNKPANSATVGARLGTDLKAADGSTTLGDADVKNASIASSHVVGGGRLFTTTLPEDGATTGKLFFQAGIPTSKAIGDLWFDSDDNNRMYIAAAAGSDAITSGEWESIGYPAAEAGATVGSGTVNTTGTVNAGEYAKFNDTDTLEARTAAEVRSDLGLGTAATLSGTGAVADANAGLVTGNVVYDYIIGQNFGSGSGDITDVIAGSGLTGGAASGAATLNVIGGTGITANANDIALSSGAALTNLGGGSGSTYLKKDGTWADPDTDTDTQLTDEEVQDIVGAMLTGNTETNIAVTYQDTDGTIDFVSTDTNTTYAISAVDGSNSDEEQLRITGSDASTDHVIFEAGTGLTIARAGDKITYTNTVTNTDTQLSQEQIEDYVDNVLTAGSNVTLNYNDAAGTLSIASTDTTYSVGDGGLTQVNFTSADNSKLDSIAESANNYVLPLKDEDDMASNSATHVSSQQSIKSYVDTEVAGLVASAPAALDTLNELAAALGDDASFATTTATSIGTKLAKASNLSDLANAGTARTNLGLGTGAVLSTAAIANGGTGLATADQIHTFVTGLGYITTDTNTTYTGGTNLTLSGGAFNVDNVFPLKSNNLSDLANAGTARTNLGLGTAATLASDGAIADNETDLVTGNVVYDYIEAQGFGSGSGDITAVVAGTGLSGGATSGSATLNVSGLTISELAAGSIQLGSESFADNDTSLMTSAAIQDKITAYGYTTNTGTTTASNSQTFTNKGGNISQWTNDSGFGTSSLALGETSSTAYRGDRGKTAYDHSQVAHAPSGAEANVSGNSGNAAIYDNSGEPALKTGITAAEIRTLIGAGSTSFDGVYSSLSGIPSTFAPIIGSGATQAMAGNTTTISGGQASAITANTAKVTFPGLGTTSTTALAGNTSLLALGTTSSTALAGDTTTITGSQASAITANTAKNTNVSTNLGYSRNGTSFTIESSDGNNVSLPVATTDYWGVMSDELYDNIIANNAKVSDVNHNTDINVNTSNLISRLGDISSAVSIGDASDVVVTIPGSLVVTGTTTTNNVQTVSTSNGVVFEGTAANDNELTLRAGVVGSDYEVLLPTAAGTLARTADVAYSSAISTGNSGLVPAAGSSGQFLAYNGAWATPSYTTALAWGAITSKPSTFAPTLGTTSTTALAGNTSLLQLGTTSTTALAGNTVIPSGASIIDWSVSQQYDNIHSGNYTNTVYALTNDLAASEITAIQNIGSETITATQWGYLGAATGAITNTDTVYTHPTTAGNKHIPSGGASGQFLKYDSAGTAVWAADNDTIYTHPTTAGNKHIPAGGSSGQFLKYTSAGTAVWAADNNTTYNTVTATAGGVLSDAQAVKFDGIATSATNTVDLTVDGAGTVHANNYTNTVYSHPTSAGNKHIPTGGSSGEFLKYDSSGTAVWATPSYISNTDNQLTNAQVIAKVLTGLSTSTGGAVAATDSILVGMGKLEKRVALNDAKATDVNHNTDVNVSTANLKTRLASDFDNVTIGVADDTVTILGDLSVGGDFNITGDLNTVSATDLDVVDATITMASGASTLALTDAAGLQFGSHASAPTFTWDNSNSRLSLNKALYSSGGFVGSITGEASAIADGAVSSADKLAADVIETAAIADNQITNATIAENAVDTTEIATDAVENAQIKENAVSHVSIATDAVRADAIQDLAVGNAAIAADINASKIGAGTLPAGRGGTGITDFANSTHANTNTTKTDVGLANVLNQAQTTTFKQDAAPTATAIGDVWIDTNDDNKMYRASATGSSNWEAITVGKGALGLVKADVGLSNVDNDSTSTIRTGTTAANVGLSNVPNVDMRNLSNATSGTVPTARGGTGLSSISTLLNTNVKTVNADGIANKGAVVEITTELKVAVNSSATILYLDNAAEERKFFHAPNINKHSQYVKIEDEYCRLLGGVAELEASVSNTYGLIVDRGVKGSEAEAHDAGEDITLESNITMRMTMSDGSTEDTNFPEFGGSSAGTGTATDMVGKPGLVPQAAVADAAKFLKGDGSWATVSVNPAGSDNQIQFNDGGTLTASSAFLFNTSNNNMQIGQGANYPRLTLAGNNGFIYFKSNDATPVTKASVGVNGTDFYIKTFPSDTERLRITTNGEWGIGGANYGSSGQVLTSGGSGAAASWTTVGGASALDGLSDSKVEGTSIWVGQGTTGSLNDAKWNVFVGQTSGPAVTTGDRNSALGYKSLNNLTTGGSNIAIGMAAGERIVGASDNIAIGDQAYMGSYGKTQGTHNVIVGSNSGRYVGNDQGDKNVAIGSYALQGDQTNTSGADYNTAVGYSALKIITTGTRNIAIGANALDNADEEDDNIAIGYDALGGAIDGGEQNVVIGNYAGEAITSADYSTLVGHNAGKGLIDGGYNTALGGYSYWRATDGTYNVIAGYQSGSGLRSGGQNIVLGWNTMAQVNNDGDGNIAIGTHSMNAATGNDVNYNTAVGHSSLQNVTEGAKNISIGWTAGNNITSGDSNVVIGAADVPIATADDQLSISSGDGDPVWITGNSSGVVDFPNGLTNNGVAIGSPYETITDVTIGSGTSGTTSGLYFGANDEAGVVAGEVSNASTANDGYIELMNCDLDTESGSSGLQTIELTVQIQDETNDEVESFKALVQGIERTVLGTVVREVNFSEWAIIYSGGGRIGTLDADYDSSDDTIRIRYQNKQGSTATLTATFYAVTMGNNT